MEVSLATTHGTMTVAICNIESYRIDESHFVGCAEYVKGNEALVFLRHGNTVEYVAVTKSLNRARIRAKHILKSALT